MGFSGKTAGIPGGLDKHPLRRDIETGRGRRVILVAVLDMAALKQNSGYILKAMEKNREYSSDELDDLVSEVEKERRALASDLREALQYLLGEGYILFTPSQKYKKGSKPL